MPQGYIVKAAMPGKGGLGGSCTEALDGWQIGRPQECNTTTATSQTVDGRQDDAFEGCKTPTPTSESLHGWQSFIFQEWQTTTTTATNSTTSTIAWVGGGRRIIGVCMSSVFDESGLALRGSIEELSSALSFRIARCFG